MAPYTWLTVPPDLHNNQCSDLQQNFWKCTSCIWAWLSNTRNHANLNWCLLQFISNDSYIASKWRKRQTLMSSIPIPPILPQLMSLLYTCITIAVHSGFLCFDWIKWSDNRYGVLIRLDSNDWRIFPLVNLNHSQLWLCLRPNTDRALLSFYCNCVPLLLCLCVTLPWLWILECLYCIITTVHSKICGCLCVCAVQIWAATGCLIFFKGDSWLLTVSNQVGAL